MPLDSVDFVQVEKTLLPRPRQGRRQGLPAAQRGDERHAQGRGRALGGARQGAARADAAVREDGLILHQLYYANEVRAFDEIDTGATFKFSDTERDLAEKLIEQLTTDEFDAEKYRDTYRDRVQAAVDQKVAGQEITVAPEQPKAQIIDLFEALKKSLSDAQAKARAEASAQDRN